MIRDGQETGSNYYREEWKWILFPEFFPFLLLPVPLSTKPNPNQIISVGSKPGMNGAGFQKGLTCESCHSEFQGGTAMLGVGETSALACEPEGLKWYVSP